MNIEGEAGLSVSISINISAPVESLSISIKGVSKPRNNTFYSFHKNIIDILNSNGTGALHEYFRIFHENIVNNIFDETFIIKLLDTKFLENMLNSVSDSRKINLLNNMYMNCLKYKDKIKLINACENCGNIMYDINNICEICGMEITFNDIIFIEDSYKKKYSCSFNQRIKRHNPNKHCEIWLLQL